MVARPGASTWLDGGAGHCASQEWPNGQSHDSMPEINTTSSCSDHQEKAFPTYIPNHDVSWRPFHANLEILPEGNMIIQELQQVVAFLLFVSDDVSSD